LADAQGTPAQALRPIARLAAPIKHSVTLPDKKVCVCFCFCLCLYV
jgi:hypothetical protein